MDILDIVYRRQVHNLALQGGVVELLNAPRCRADVQLRLIVGVGHIAHQVDTATAGVGALDVDFAHLCPQQADGNILGCVNGIVVSSEGTGLFRPAGIVVFEPAQESRLFQPSCYTGGFVSEHFGIGVNADFTCPRERNIKKY